MHASASQFSGADGPYWAALAQGRLQLPRCVACGRWHWPAVFRCGTCAGWEMAWEEVPMHGEIYSWSRSWHAFGGAEDLSLPYVSLLVALPQAGGCRLLGVLEGEDAGLKIGAAVQGRAATTMLGARQIPALRWRLRP